MRPEPKFQDPDLDWLRSITRFVRRRWTFNNAVFLIVFSVLTVSIYATVKQRVTVEVSR